MSEYFDINKMQNCGFIIDHSYNLQIYVEEGELKQQISRTLLVLIPVLTERS